MRIWEKILAVLFPTVCEICGNPSPDGAVCDDCRRQFARECFEKCPVCAMPAGKCECGTDFTSVTRVSVGGRRFFSLAFYRSEKSYGVSERITERAILDLKSNSRFAAFFAEELARGIRSLWNKENKELHDWIVTYPPRSSKKLYENGFDQAEELARLLAEKLGCAYAKTAYRVGKSVEQKGLTGDERDRNAKESLAPVSRNIRTGGKYLLVDDIVTSGATMRKMAELLYENGAAAVFPVALAKTMPKSGK